MTYQTDLDVARAFARRIELLSSTPIAADGGWTNGGAATICRNRAAVMASLSFTGREPLDLAITRAAGTSFAIEIDAQDDPDPTVPTHRTVHIQSRRIMYRDSFCDITLFLADKEDGELSTALRRRLEHGSSGSKGQTLNAALFGSAVSAFRRLVSAVAERGTPSEDEEAMRRVVEVKRTCAAAIETIVPGSRFRVTAQYAARRVTANVASPGTENAWMPIDLPLTEEMRDAMPGRPILVCSSGQAGPRSGLWIEIKPGLEHIADSGAGPTEAARMIRRLGDGHAAIAAAVQDAIRKAQA